MGYLLKTLKLKTPILLPVALSISLLTGCASTVILVPPRTPVQIAEPVETRVFVVQKDGTKIKSQNKVRLEAGWWVAEVPE